MVKVILLKIKHDNINFYGYGKCNEFKSNNYKLKTFIEKDYVRGFLTGNSGDKIKVTLVHSVSMLLCSVWNGLDFNKEDLKIVEI